MSGDVLFAPSCNRSVEIKQQWIYDLYDLVEAQPPVPIEIIKTMTTAIFLDDMAKELFDRYRESFIDGLTNAGASIFLQFEDFCDLGDLRRAKCRSDLRVSFLHVGFSPKDIVFFLYSENCPKKVLEKIPITSMLLEIGLINYVIASVLQLKDISVTLYEIKAKTYLFGNICGALTRIFAYNPSERQLDCLKKIILLCKRSNGTFEPLFSDYIRTLNPTFFSTTSYSWFFQNICGAAELDINTLGGIPCDPAVFIECGDFLPICTIRRESRRTMLIALKLIEEFGYNVVWIFGGSTFEQKLNHMVVDCSQQAIWTCGNDFRAFGKYVDSYEAFEEILPHVGLARTEQFYEIDNEAFLDSHSADY